MRAQTGVAFAGLAIALYAFFVASVVLSGKRAFSWEAFKDTLLMRRRRAEAAAAVAHHHHHLHARPRPPAELELHAPNRSEALGRHSLQHAAGGAWSPRLERVSAPHGSPGVPHVTAAVLPVVNRLSLFRRSRPLAAGAHHVGGGGGGAVTPSEGVYGGSRSSDDGGASMARATLVGARCAACSMSVGFVSAECLPCERLYDAAASRVHASAPLAVAVCTLPPDRHRCRRAIHQSLSATPLRRLVRLKVVRHGGAR